MKISTYGPSGLSYLALDLPSSATAEQAYAAVQAHYADLYGSEVTITVEHLCTTPEDREAGTWAHSAAVQAQCEHGLSQRICTVDVVTQRDGR